MSRLYEKINYVDLTDLDDIENKITRINVDDQIDMMLLNEFRDWYGYDKIETNSFEDKWDHFLDVREVK
tara:strand:- start:62 stop:268 length:207 start_codon:yes stop_codon:yes gene_type:complete